MKPDIYWWLPACLILLALLWLVSGAHAGCLVTRPSVSGTYDIRCDNAPPIVCYPPVGGIGSPTCY